MTVGISTETRKEMLDRAMGWAVRDRGGAEPVLVSREAAINEEHLALDAIDLLAEIERLEDRLHTEPVRGAEADELRRGVERLLDAWPGPDAYDRLIALLDRVDARDSLAHVERVDELAKIATEAIELAEELNGDAAACSYNLPIGERLTELGARIATLKNRKVPAP